MQVTLVSFRVGNRIRSLQNTKLEFCALEHEVTSVAGYKKVFCYLSFMFDKVFRNDAHKMLK
jgi:hypothetical protein